ncbi:hypothetical protein PG994_013564 [Apiospora phragmitis]|uniref:Uncharacterized protein n=1 Tax=Apiospora phragmitis TaxID=2905665 RepID=A0ABR1T902_9PEZI
MEYQPTSTPSYPPQQPSRPGPTPLANIGPAPALYPSASGAVAATGYPSSSAPAPAGGNYYSDNVQQHQLPPPPARVSTSSSGDRSIKSARTTCEFAAREYMTQLRRIPYGSGSSYSVSEPMAMDAMARARTQQGLVLDELQTLRRRLAVVIKEAEAHRWRKWVLGGVLKTIRASIMPLVRRIFRRQDSNKKGEDSNNKTATAQTEGSNSSSNTNSNALMNATEYAFAKSRSLIKRIRASMRGSGWFLGGFAAVAFFVLSVLYVFENEVSLRVAKTVSKRLKRLAAKVERGGGGGQEALQQQLDEKDLAVLQQGWRWRVLTWSG